MLTTKDILNRLKALREEKDLRQEYIARRLGIDRTTYVRKESGAIPITTEEWLKLADAMEQDPAYFFSLQRPYPDTPEGARERLLIKLYRSLSQRQKEEFICGIHIMLKGIKKKAVRDTLEELRGI